MKIFCKTIFLSAVLSICIFSACTSLSPEDILYVRMETAIRKFINKNRKAKGYQIFAFAYKKESRKGDIKRLKNGKVLIGQWEISFLPKKGHYTAFIGKRSSDGNYFEHHTILLKLKQNKDGTFEVISSRPMKEWGNENIESKHVFKFKRKHVFEFKIHPSLKLMTFVLYNSPKSKFEIEKIEIYSKNVSTPFQIIGRRWAPLPLFRKKRCLEALDMNFDGYKDIRLMLEQGATGNTRYHVWLYNPKTQKFDYHLEYGDLTSPSYNPKTKLISTFSKGGHSSNINGSEAYKIINGKLVMITKYKQVYNKKDDNYLYTIWKRVDGKMKQVKHGVVLDKCLSH